MRLLRELSRRKLRTSLTVLHAPDDTDRLAPGLWINGADATALSDRERTQIRARDRIIRMRDGLIVGDERVADIGAVAA